MKNKEFIEEQVYQYIQSTLAHHTNMMQVFENTGDQKFMTQTMPNFISALKRKHNEAKTQLSSSLQEVRFGLTQAEVLQIVNLMPTELVELHLIIDQLDQRLDEAQQQQLLLFIQEQKKLFAD